MMAHMAKLIMSLASSSNLMLHLVERTLQSCPNCAMLPCTYRSRPANGAIVSSYWGTASDLEFPSCGDDVAIPEKKHT